jgi:hypothetical protein
MTDPNLPAHLQYLIEPANRHRYTRAKQTAAKAIKFWEPNAGRQTQAHESLADVTGYGGAAGGGKSDLLLGTAAKQHWRSAIYRRHYTDLSDLITRGDEIFAGLTSYVSGEKRRWELPDGRMINLAAVQHKNDLKKFQGRARDFIGIDEAAEFPEDWFRFLTGWLRTTRKGQRTRVVLTFNPPQTPEGEWVVRYFAPWIDPDYPGTPAEPGELRYFIRDPHKDEDVEVSGPDPVEIEGRFYKPQSRTFIPAKIADNPHLTSDYEAQLNMLPDLLRRQLRDGDFSVRAKDDIWQIIPTQWILLAQRRWREQGRPDVALRSASSDPARGGDDKHSIAKLYGTYFELHQFTGAATPDGIVAANQVLEILGGERAPLYVDVVGIGASAYDHLKVIPGLQVHPVNNAGKALGKDKSGKYTFANVRAASYWRLREALDPASGENICLPDTREVRMDLSAPHYEVVGGAIKVEPKDNIRTRIGRSPDDGDAIVMAWYGAVAGRMAMPIFIK